MAQQKNPGASSTEAVQHCDDETRGFAESGQMEPAADDAKRAEQAPEAEALKQAKAEGKRHALGEHPQVKR